MNEEQKEFNTRWVAALTSGNFPQVEGALRTSEGFCCLGVACNLVDPLGWGKGYKDEVWEALFYNWKELLSRDVPYDFIENLTGLYRWQVEELVDMNDGGIPFLTIAENIIEYMSNDFCEFCGDKIINPHIKCF
ncbi:MAG: hypothetical protein KGI54_13250 [Pseudomonadota bacterium]|nr:hypothetical protein [Pseudomonadota bacterium]